MFDFDVWSMLPEDGETLIFGEDCTPKVGETVTTEDGKRMTITRSLGGPNFMSFGVPEEE